MSNRLPLDAPRMRWLAVLILWSVGGMPAMAAAEGPDYGEAVAPLLRKYCVGCHGGDEPESGLSLENYVALTQGGKRGAAIVAGREDLSRLLLTVEGKIEPKMPPEDNEAPSADEVAVLRSWIVSGAKGPDGAEPDPTKLLVPKIAPRTAPRRAITALAWSPKDKLLAAGSYREVRLLAADDRSVVRNLAGLRGEVNGVSFSADGSRLVVASGEPGLIGEATIWQVADGTLLRTIEGHRDTLYAAILSPDGTILATGSYDQKIRLWDASSGAELRTIDGHNGAVYDLAFSPDGRLLASASGDRTVKLWNVADGSRLDTFGQPTKEQTALAFSPDGRVLAGAGADNRIRLWRLSDTAAEGTNPLIETRFAHEGAILDLVFSADGKRLASAADDRTVKLWQASPLVEEHALAEQSDWPQALAYSPDGKQLAIGRMDGSLTLVEAESGQPVQPGKPELAAVEPRGVQRGQTARIRLTGKHLVEIANVEFEPPGPVATIAADQPSNGGELWLDVAVSAEAALGSYKLQLVNPGGKSNALKLELDDLAQALEQEPNGTPAAGPVVALPASVWGVLDKQGDVDHVRFEARAGQTLVFDLRSRTLGMKLDGVLTLLDEAGHVLASNNNFDGEDDSVLSYRFTTPGVYAIRVGDQVLAGSAEHGYRLSLGELPLVTGCYPPSIPAAATTPVALVGYNLPADAVVAVTAGDAPEVAVPIDANRFRRRRDLRVAVDPFPQTREAEPNDDPPGATAIAAPGVAVGQISSATDVDLFRFDAKAGQTWIVETDAARRQSPIDTKLEILDAAGTPVPRMLLQATRDSYVTFRGINSAINDVRLVNWEEMELNEYLYLQGEVCRLFRLPQGPDSGFLLYANRGSRLCYFDTSPTNHAVDEPAYIVRPLPLGAAIVPNGLPVFTVPYANDDDGTRRLGSDSQLTFTAPADGSYLVRLTDVRALGDERFVYRLIVRAPQPDFVVQVGGTGPRVRAGSGRSIPLSLDRIDGFEGDVRVEFSGVPAGMHITSPVVIEAGHNQAFATIWAERDAPKLADDATATAQVTATAEIDGRTVTKTVGDLGRIGLEAPGKLEVRLEPAEVTLRPGTTVTAQLRVERRGVDGPISFAVENLPHGVYVDNIGLNGVLIPEGQTERQIFLTARPWVPATTRTFHAVASSAGSEVSPPLVLHVHRDEAVARTQGE